MARAEGPGPAEQPDATTDPPIDIVWEVEAPGNSAPSYPAGLTREGREAFARLREENARLFERRLAHELGLGWMELNLDGPEQFTRDRVEQANEVLQAKDRLEVLDEERRKIRVELVEELQSARQMLDASRRQYRRRLLSLATVALTGMSLGIAGIISKGFWSSPLPLTSIAVTILGLTLGYSAFHQTSSIGWPGRAGLDKARAPEPDRSEISYWNKTESELDELYTALGPPPKDLS